MSRYVKTEEDKLISRDRMRFVKNSACSNLCYLALLFDVFYFVLLYRQDVASYYYTVQIGASIVYNLVFMLIVFMCSENVKHYHKNYSYVVLAAGIMQIVRIFVIPTRAHNTVMVIKEVEQAVMDDWTYTKAVVYLVVSAAALIISAVLNYARCTALEAHVKSLEKTNA